MKMSARQAVDDMDVVDDIDGEGAVSARFLTDFFDFPLKGDAFWDKEKIVSGAAWVQVPVSRSLCRGVRTALP